MIALKVKLAPDATLPHRAHRDDAGLDLAVINRFILEPNGFMDVPTGVYVQLPAGTWGLLVGRSSTLRKHGLRVALGVIDVGYRGELFVAVEHANRTREPVVIEAGTRLAQLIVLGNVTGECEVEYVTELGEHERGVAGFGSSGL